MDFKSRNYSSSVVVGNYDFFLKISSLFRNLELVFRKNLKTVSLYLHSLRLFRSGKTSGDANGISGSTNQSMKRGSNKKALRIIAVGLVLIALVVGISKFAGKLTKSSANVSQSTDVKPPKASTTINKEFTFPLKDEKGKQVAEVKYIIDSAELRDEILVKGTRATAVKGRVFLILTVRIKNDFKSSIQMNTKDYVRLSVDGNENEWLAPDIHNDPVEVQAISTKLTRLGFAIDENVKNFVVAVGEIDGQKEKFNLEFK